MTDAPREPPRVRLDEEKLEMLRRWGEGLRQTNSDEFAAAGRAILMLIDEIEQLHVDLWHARQVVTDAADEGAPKDAPPQEAGLARTLRERLRRRRGAESDVFPDVVPQAVEDDEDFGGDATSDPLPE